MSQVRQNEKGGTSLRIMSTLQLFIGNVSARRAPVLISFDWDFVAKEGAMVESMKSGYRVRGREEGSGMAEDDVNPL